MKKVLVVITVISIFMTGCSNGITQEEYDIIAAERIKAIEERDSALSKYNTLLAQYDTLMKENNEFKKIIEPYRDLSDAELLAKTNEAELNAKNKQIELDKIKEQEDAERIKKEKEEKAAREKEEKIGYNTGITYDQLARTPDDYINKKVKFTGEAIQIIEGSYQNQIRLAIDSDYDKIILITYVKSIVTSRVLEDDIITIYGVSDGLISYQSTMGGMITIPSVLVDKIDQ